MYKKVTKLMKNTSIYLLEFDAIVGPKIVCWVGEDVFDDGEKNLLQSDAFPDTAIQQDQESTIFLFKIKKKFCFSMFTTRPDSSAPRGHKQHTFVIASDYPYIYPFTRLLQSSLVLGDIPPKDILNFIEDFIIKWFSNFPENVGEIVELPMFDGTLPVTITDNHMQLLSFYGGMGWTPLSKIYYLNNNFLGFDLFTTLSLQSLITSQRCFDIIKLWEAAIIGETILVYGATPTIASSCCLTIGSFLFPEDPPDAILPFISVTDQRFMQVGNPELFPHVIVGVSNPIALTKSNQFAHTFTVGFQSNENGLNDQKMQWNFIKECHGDLQIEIRKFLYQNTLRMIDAVTSALNVIRVNNPYAEFLGQFDVYVLEQQILAKRPLLFSKPRIVARKIMRSPFLSRIWKRRCTTECLQHELQNFNIAKLCKGKGEHELVDLISTVMEVRHSTHNGTPLEAFIERDIEEIKHYLAPDLILAPIN